jgi:Uma2 family endonuclease
MTILAVQEPTRRPITVEMYHVMAEKGAFHPDDRVELIGGELFDMSPIGNLHARCVKFLADYFITLLSGNFIVGVQDPIVLGDDSEPQPDLSILDFKSDFYRDSTPTAENVVVIIEVADSSVDFDRNTKLDRYAAAGIPEAWLIDLISERVEIHSQPTANGYGLVKMCHRGENAASQAIQSIDLTVNDILG